MPADYDLSPVLGFLSDLEQNNERAWFEQNRAAFERARAAFERFVDALIGEVDTFDDLGGISARDCVFRIYRDVRFSKDKSPYKTNMGASLAPGGRRAAEIPYYLHIEPRDRSFVAGGLYAPSPEQLANVRQALDNDAGDLKRAISSPDFVATYGGLTGERLKTVPQGYARDHPEIELLKHKQLVARHPLTDRDVLAPDFLAQVAGSFRALKPLLEALRGMVV